MIFKIILLLIVGTNCSALPKKEPSTPSPIDSSTKVNPSSETSSNHIPKSEFHHHHKSAIHIPGVKHHIFYPSMLYHCTSGIKVESFIISEINEFQCHELNIHIVFTDGTNNEYLAYLRNYVTSGCLSDIQEHRRDDDCPKIRR